MICFGEYVVWQLLVLFILWNFREHFPMHRLSASSFGVGPSVCGMECVLQRWRQFMESAGMGSDHRQNCGAARLCGPIEDPAAGIGLHCGAMCSLWTFVHHPLQWQTCTKPAKLLGSPTESETSKPDAHCLASAQNRDQKLY